MTINATQANIDRFMTFVDKLPCGCWFWTGARSRGKGNKKWYGSFWVDGQMVRAHRFSCDVIGKKGPLPKGMHRSHSCHFSLCVNPDCLDHETPEKNQADKVARLRLEDWVDTDKSVCPKCQQEFCNNEILVQHLRDMGYLPAPMCRDCADSNGSCMNKKGYMPCDPDERRRLHCLV